MGLTGPSRQPIKASSQAFEEPETPISTRTLTKATTPPVTIKNFFKPKAVEQTLDADVGTSENTAETSGENDCVKKECGLTNIKQEIESSARPSEKQSAAVTSKKEVKSIYFKSKGAKQEECSQRKGTAEGPSRCNGLAHHLSEPLSKTNLQGKNSLKRSGSSDASLRSIKRQKQSSILCSFGKRTENPGLDGIKKEIFCPVCGVKFASEAKNADINKHIDGCLIE